MNNEKQKILDMLEKGTITPADAAKLLECLGESQREETALVLGIARLPLARWKWARGMPPALLPR